MELCVDNPRSGFADLFATHPSVQARVDALVKFAGGHDPGPLPELPQATEAAAPQTDPETEPAPAVAPPRRRSPWGRRA
jgi:heat shock protein HtpX